MSWDHTVLPVTWHRWHSCLYPSELRLLLNWATLEGCKAELTCGAVVDREFWRWRTPTWSHATCFCFLTLVMAMKDACWRKESIPPSRYGWHSTELSSTHSSMASIRDSLTLPSFQVQLIACLPYFPTGFILLFPRCPVFIYL